MKTAFYNECGKGVEKFTDIEMKFKAVASEIFAVSSFCDYIMKQGFAQTATLENLDRHAELRGITRKRSSLARGELTFSLSEESNKDVTVPKGTICSVKGLPYIQFATDADAVIKAGSLNATVGATALKPGSEFNVNRGDVTVIVNPPEYVSEVYNNSYFIGGCDEENDESLRERLLASYSVKNNGVNPQSIRGMILENEDVLDASVHPTDNYTIAVCLKTRNWEISGELMAEIENMLGFATVCGVQIEFIEAEPKPFFVGVDAEIINGYNRDTIEAEIKKRIKRYCSNCKIGKSLSISELTAVLQGIDGAEHFDVFARTLEGPLNCGTNEFLYLEAVEAAVHE